jgi:hypothetical protein
LVKLQQFLAIRHEPQPEIVQGTLSCSTKSYQSVEHARIGRDGCCGLANNCYARGGINGETVGLDGLKVIGSATRAAACSGTSTPASASRSTHTATGIRFINYEHDGKTDKNKKHQNRHELEHAHRSLLQKIKVLMFL